MPCTLTQHHLIATPSKGGVDMYTHEMFVSRRSCRKPRSGGRAIGCSPRSSSCLWMRCRSFMTSPPKRYVSAWGLCFSVQVGGSHRGRAWALQVHRGGSSDSARVGTCLCGHQLPAIEADSICHWWSCERTCCRQPCFLHMACWLCICSDGHVLHSVADHCELSHESHHLFFVS